MRYKVGDKVKVKSDLKNGGLYDSVAFILEMDRFLGKYVTIREIDIKAFRVPVYKVKESEFAFTDAMLEDEIEKGLEKNVKDFNIKSYKVCDNDGVKTVVVKFEDGSDEHAVCCADDQFELKRGIEVCILKKVLGRDNYKTLLRKAMNQVKAIDKAEEDKKKAEETALAAEKAYKAKIEKKKAKRIAKKRAARIEEMKEAYLAAMKEHGKECAVCESFLDDIK